MVWGVTSTGFNRPTFDDLLTEAKQAIRDGAHNKLTLDPKDPLGALLLGRIERDSDAWQAIEAAYNAMDPSNADDFAAENQAALQGVYRRAATKGTVTTTCTLDAGVYDATTFVAHVVGQPTNRWVGVGSVTSTGGATTVLFEAETAGVNQALANTLTVIADGGVEGWSAITNPTDATPGKDIETIEELLLRKDQVRAQLGSNDTAAIKGAVELLDGVLSCKVYENNTSNTVNSIPPKSVRVVVYDNGGDADDDEIAQAIFGNRAAGIGTYGAQSGTAVDANGADRTESFDRATVTALHIAIDVSVSPTADANSIKLALIGAVPQETGSTVRINQLICDVLEVAGVVDVNSLLLDTSDPPLGAVNLTADVEEAFTLDSANIDITGL